MIRYLKILLAAAAALTALGAIGASGAQAAEFHCSVAPCKFTLNPDGTGKTAHHVLVIENQNTSESVSFTCPVLSGEGISTSATTGEATTTNLSYDGGTTCKAAGSVAIHVFMNGCDYHFTAGGQVTIKCPEKQVIEIENEIGCVYTIGPQGPLNGVGYTNITGPFGDEEITAFVDVHGIDVSAHGTRPTCLIDPNQDLEGTYTTGNTLVTAESQDGVMVDGWWTV